MAREDKGGKREYGDPRCRGCRAPLGSVDVVRIGGKRYHQECAEKKPRYRQEWGFQTLQWKRIGIWSDEEQVTMEAHNGG